LPAEELWRAKGNEMKKTTKVATGGVVSARRRLIRGAFAAPTALTLYSGNVFAASSSLRALGNQIDNAEFPDPVTEAQLDPTDTWIRVKVWEWTDPNDSAKKVLLVQGNEVIGLPYGCGSSFVMGGQWAAVATSEVFDTNGAIPVETNPLQWAALRYDREGYVVGVSTADQDVMGTSALTKSAGASIGLAGACH
jgi:hypothetical protein